MDDLTRIRSRGYRGTWWQNLARRPDKPASGRGRMQRRARRMFRWQDGVSTREIAGEGRRDPRHVRRVLARIGAVRVGRTSTRGRPWLWRKPQEEDR